MQKLLQDALTRSLRYLESLPQGRGALTAADLQHPDTLVRPLPGETGYAGNRIHRFIRRGNKAGFQYLLAARFLPSWRRA